MHTSNNMSARKKKTISIYTLVSRTLVNENEKLPQIDCADSATVYNIRIPIPNRD